MNTGSVLILTHPEDVHADAVQVHLDAIGVEVHRMDTARFGSRDIPVTARFWNGCVNGWFGACDLAQVRAVWHRRPSRIEVSDASDSAELTAAVGGVLAALPYLNHPADMAAAGFKPFQLALAGRCALNVPETVVSSSRRDGAVLASAAGGTDRVVVKPMSKVVGGVVRPNDVRGWSRVMHMTQRAVEKSCDMRVTAVDGELFCARIDSPFFDWRTDINRCRYSPDMVPEAVGNGIRRLLARLRLRFAALDFAVDRGGNWWFLEVNPNGQWLWIEHETGLPIARAIANALAGTSGYL